MCGDWSVEGALAASGIASGQKGEEFVYPAHTTSAIALAIISPVRGKGKEGSQELPLEIRRV